MKEIIYFGLVLVIISIIIYIAKNNKDIEEFVKRYKDKKWIKIIFICGVIICCLIIANYIYTQINILIANVNWFEKAQANDQIFAESDEKISKESKFYAELIKKDFSNQKYNEPYIPDGFEYVEGEWNNGFVIQDTNKNQYVWVPCTNKKDAEVETLKRHIFSRQAFISKDVCYNEEYEKFLTSAFENGGFYVSRFEIGNENNLPVSKKGVEIWNDVTRTQAIEIVDKMYKNSNLNCELINGYAYDTIFAWIMKTNDTQSTILDFSKQENLYTGKREYNNIYDIYDNVMEYTLETNYSNVVIRGFANSSENKEEIESIIGDSIDDYERLTIQKDDNYFTISSLLGFRTVLYK